MQAAAKILLHDWNDGRIPFFTMPPQRTSHGHAAAAVMPSWSQDFNIDQVSAVSQSVRSSYALPSTCSDRHVPCIGMKRTAAAAWLQSAHDVVLAAHSGMEGVSLAYWVIAMASQASHDSNSCCYPRMRRVLPVPALCASTESSWVCHTCHAIQEHTRMLL